MILITNRTDPRTPWGREDIERICRCINEIVANLKASGEEVDIHANEIWNEVIVHREDLEVVRNYIEALRELVGVSTECPIINRLTVEKANDIEKLLDAIQRRVAKYDYLYCGMAYAGGY